MALFRKYKKYKKLNIGCGWDKRDGYLNIDVDPNCKPDLLIVDNDFSKIPKNHFEEIVANDVLEHISHSQTLGALLDWSEYLGANGKLKLQTSSILGVAREMGKSKKYENQVGWTICLFGNQAHPGDFHHIGFTEATLKVNLLAAGFKLVKFEEKDKWLFHVLAKKAYDWTDVITKNAKLNNQEYTDVLFDNAFGRKPDNLGGTHILQGLESGELSRYDAAKHLLQSRERLYYVAKQNKL